MEKWVFLNDDLIEEEKATVHFKDLAFQRGYGVFDFFRIQENKPLFLNDHLDRFYASACGLHLPIAGTRQQLMEKIEALVSKNGQPESGIRLSLTGGYSEDGFNPGRPNFLVTQHSFTNPGPEQVQKGIRLFTYPHRRQLPEIKSIDYLMAVWLQPKRVEAGADDILYYQDGLISECPRSNFFLVTADNRILTPAAHVLKGITRKKLIELAEKEFVVEERDISLDDMHSAKEAFITSTTKQVLPVRQIDSITYPQTAVSLHLRQRFRLTYLEKQQPV